MTPTGSVYVTLCSESGLPRTDQSDNEAAREPATAENVVKTDRRLSRRKSVLLLLLFFLFNTLGSKNLKG